MRSSPNCAAVTRELAVPAGGLDPAALAAHLTSCPRCASRAAEAARFDRLWAATRPEEPPAAVWGETWERIESALEASEAPTRPAREAAPVLSFSRSRRARVAALLLAQAAAVLAAVLVLFRGGSPPGAVPAPTPASAPALVQIPPTARTVIVRPEGDRLALEVVDLVGDDEAGGPDLEADLELLSDPSFRGELASNFDMLNFFEAQAE